MAQTTGAMTLAALKVEVNTGAFPTNAIDISGISTDITISGGDLNLVKAFTFGTSTPILAAGNLDSIDVEIKALYSEASTDAYSTIEGWYAAKTPVYVRYCPKGAGTTGDLRFTSDAGYITAHPYPAGTAEGTDFAMYTLKISVPKITRAAIT